MNQPQSTFVNSLDKHSNTNFNPAFSASFDSSVNANKSNKLVELLKINESVSPDDESQVSQQLISQVLKNFNHHGLDDLNDAKLMNRVDSKFILPMSFLPELLAQVRHLYSVLEINGKRISNYHNQYFDTPQMSFYHDHHNGKLNRYKVRRRHYLDTDTEFLEVKLKNNQKRTVKTRIKLNDKTGEHSLCSQFLSEQIANFDNSLDICQQGGYQRIALANEAIAERLTLDFNLWYQDRRGNNKIKALTFLSNNECQKHFSNII